MYETTLAERINIAMEEREMTQADIARKTGLSTAIVAQICTGRTADPGFTKVVKIAKALDVSLSFLAGD